MGRIRATILFGAVVGMVVCGGAMGGLLTLEFLSGFLAFADRATPTGAMVARAFVVMFTMIGITMGAGVGGSVVFLLPQE